MFDLFSDRKREHFYAVALSFSEVWLPCFASVHCRCVSPARTDCRCNTSSTKDTQMSLSRLLNIPTKWPKTANRGHRWHKQPGTRPEPYMKSKPRKVLSRAYMRSSKYCPNSQGNELNWQTLKEKKEKERWVLEFLKWNASKWKNKVFLTRLWPASERLSRPDTVSPAS